MTVVEFARERCTIPTVSIAMCTYNGARYLPRQLQTIAAQTLPPLELVVQDDRSTDDTVAILERFASTVAYPVRLHRNARQLGSAQNFGTCLLRCAGDVVVLTDQDDMWFEDRLERTVAAFMADPGLAFTYSDAPLIDGDDRPVGRTIFDSVPIKTRDRKLLAESSSVQSVVLRYGVLYGATMAARRDLVTRILPIPPDWSHDEWISLTLGVLGRSARLQPVTHYRQHSAQVVGAGNATLATTMRSARNRTPGHYDAEAERHRQAIRAAGLIPELQTGLVPALTAKLQFLQDRRRVHHDGISQLPRLLRQIAGGGYTRFAGGNRSILKDLLILSRTFFRSGTTPKRQDEDIP